MVNKEEDKPEDKPVPPPEGSATTTSAPSEDAGTAETPSAIPVTPATAETTTENAPSTSSETATSSPKKEPVPPPVETRKMRAVILTSFGGLKGVKMAERPYPAEPKENQVTIKVDISGMNFQDLMVRLGFNDNPPQPKTPFILGTELIGTVIATGPQVQKVKVDDLIFALPENGGAWAEYVTLDEKFVWKVSKPEIGLENLSSTLAYLLADLLLERSGCGAGSNVLVHSAGGAVGLAIKDLAKLKGASVIGIASQIKFEKMQGFSHLIPRGVDYIAEIKKLHPEGVDAVFDCQGGDDCARGMSILTPYGTYILYCSANIVTGETKSILSVAKSWWSTVEKVSPMRLYDENKGVVGLHFRRLVKSSPDKIQLALNRVWELMSNGAVKPVQDLTYHFEQVPQAMQRMHERKNVGKVVIVPEVAPLVPTPPQETTPPATTPQQPEATTSSSTSQQETTAEVKKTEEGAGGGDGKSATDGNETAPTNNEQSPPTAAK